MTLVTEDAEWERIEDDLGRISVEVDERLAADFESSEYKGISGRSRLVRLGQDFEVLEYGRADNELYADVTPLNRTESVNVELSDGDEVARFFAYDDEDILRDNELEESLRNSSIEYEILNDEKVAIELDYGFLRPNVSGEVSMEEIESVDKDDLVREYPGWDAGLVERRDHYVKSNPVKMPIDAHGIILGTEHPQDEHYNSPLVDAGYGQNSPNGNSIIFEMDYQAEHVDGHKPRPVMRFIEAE